MTKILATAAAALMLASPVWAQSQSDQSSQSSQSSSQKQASDRSAKPSDIPLNQLSMVGADTLSKSTVRDAAGKEIGKVDNVIIDTKSGQVAYAIVSANGKNHVVPWQRLQPANQPESLTLNANKEALDGAPTVDKSTLAELRTPDDQQRIAAFWQNVQAQQAQVPAEQKGSEKSR